MPVKEYNHSYHIWALLIAFLRGLVKEISEEVIKIF
jgi:hypothetical protein